VAIYGRPVFTIDDLHSTASDLLVRVQSRGWNPDLIVGIERGGAEIARAMSTDSGIPLVTLRIQRPSTSAKNQAPNMLRGVLPRAPRWAADLLRRLEDQWLTLKVKDSPTVPQAMGDISDRDTHGDLGLLSRASCILIVDDAIDSGSTLTAASDYVDQRSAPTAVTVRAVVTRTRPKSPQAISPEVVLHEGVLVRFPWALDYRPPRRG
jgi:hypoxanthine phosphoribosyltransferase